MEKIGDIMRVTTAQEIKAHLQALGDEMQRTVQGIRALKRMDDIALLSHNLLEMTLTQVYRISLWLNDAHDLIAWAARNILELDMLYRFAIQSKENLSRIYADSIVDAIEIDARFKELALQTGNAAHVARYEASIARHHDFAKLVGLDLGKMKPINTFEIAKAEDLETEFRLLSKVNAKYIHPTSWRLVGDASMTETVDFKNVMLMQAQLHAIHILKQVSEVMGVAHEFAWDILQFPDP